MKRTGHIWGSIACVLMMICLGGCQGNSSTGENDQDAFAADGEENTGRPADGQVDADGKESTGQGAEIVRT